MSQKRFNFKNMTNFEIAENKKHYYIQSMIDSSLKDLEMSPQNEIRKKQSAMFEPQTPAPNFNKRSQQSDEKQPSNIFSSQITQENSGISYAFKAHLLISTFDRIKLRKLSRSFHALAQKKHQINKSIQKILQECKGCQNRDELLENFCKTKDNQKNMKITPQLPISNILKQIQFKNSHKFLKKQAFQYKLKITDLQNKIKWLENELAEAKRRQQKQISKKKASLQSLAEQLTQKNQIIQQLKVMVRNLQNKLCAKQKNNAYILEQDTETQRRSIVHLQSINDKLNYEIARLKQNQKVSKDKTLLLIKENDKMKSDIFRLKQEIFTLDILKDQITANKKQCQIWQSKLKNKKMQLSLAQKRINEAKRQKIKTQGKINSSWTQKNLNPLIQQTQQNKIISMEIKLQGILSFLFHIQNSNFQLSSPQLFDQQQKELLKAHQMKYLSGLNSIKQQNIKQAKKYQKNNQTINDFELSVVDILQKQYLKAQVQFKYQQSLKQLKNQNQKNNLRQKISELKQKLLIIRSVLLNFLKSLQLKSLKKQTSNILDLLFQCFQYSQDERLSIFPSKPKKFFGFI